jgi:hypothetical protein
MNGRPWTKHQREKFKATMVAKKKAGTWPPTKKKPEAAKGAFTALALLKQATAGRVPTTRPELLVALAILELEGK